MDHNGLQFAISKLPVQLHVIIVKMWIVSIISYMCVVLCIRHVISGTIAYVIYTLWTIE
jgi:hypothetical protein